MRPSDERFIAGLGGLVFDEYARKPGPGVLTMARRGRTVVAVEDGDPVGFAIVEMNGAGAAHLTAITVAEHARGRGVAHALLGAAENVAKRAGARALGLVTADSNVAALGLFLHSGFERVERVARYYQRGQNAVRMEKIL